MKYLFFIVFYFYVSLANTQDYLFPIRPNHQNFISGSMGEPRNGHFHAGIDIKTGGQVGLPVYATQKGYVYRIKVQGRGYGKAIYLKHPDGNISVYGHLSDFQKEIASLVLKRQYQKQWYEVDIYPQKNIFKFEKGDIIAYSGNSGSSSGPHLHFEIRNAKEVPLDLLTFHFRELHDNIKPVLKEIAIDPLAISSRIEGEFEKKFFYVKKNKIGNYTIEKPVNASGLIGLSYRGYDRMNQTHNKYGINYVSMQVNNKKVYQHHIKEVAFHHTHAIDVFIDYEVWVKSKKKLIRCYIARGNKLPFYKESPSNGYLYIEEGKKYEINMIFYDSYGNASELNFQIIGNKNIQEFTLSPKEITSQKMFNLYNDILKISLPDTITTLEVETLNKREILNFTYLKGNYNIFLWNMKKEVPKRFFLNKTDTITFPYHHIFNTYTNRLHLDNFQISIPNNALYSTAYLDISSFQDKNSGNNLYRIGNENIPLIRSLKITIFPEEEILNKEKVSVYHYLKNNQEMGYKGGNWKGNSISFSSGSLGDFLLLTDSIPPTIKYKGFVNGEIQLEIDDKLSGIGKFNAYLNDEWLLMNYDFKTGLLSSQRFVRTKPLKGNFILKVYDKQGNFSLFQKQI